MSGVLELDKSHFDSFHTYGVWWKPNTTPQDTDGFVRFYRDGIPWYEIRDTALIVSREDFGKKLGGEGEVWVMCGYVEAGLQRFSPPFKFPAWLKGVYNDHLSLLLDISELWTPGVGLGSL